MHNACFSNQLYVRTITGFNLKDLSHNSAIKKVSCTGGGRQVFPLGVWTNSLKY